MDKILARVGALTVTAAEVDEFLLSMGQRAQSYNNPEGRKIILEQLIGNKLLLQDARRNLYEAEPEFKAQLAKMKDELLVNYTANKLLATVTVSDKECREYYEANLDKLGGGEVVNASHILVESEAQALDILSEIKGGLSFEDAAEKYSSCPSKANGGNLGEFGRGQMVPEFDKAVFEMEVGTVTETPVKTQFGYHLIKLIEKKTSEAPAYEEVAPQLREMLIGDKRRRAYESKLNQLRIMYPVDMV